MTPALGQALREWRRVLGDRHVVTAPGALGAAGTATFRTGQRVLAILRPRRRSEVQACLRIANRWRVPVHPVSCGKNWGYGSRVPVRDHSVLIDLGRMDRIVAFDERLAWVTLEPGVTFRRLHAFLNARRSNLHASPTGSTPESSPLANALERGIGQGPLGDRFEAVCGLEVVLPDGSCVQTGSRSFGAATAELHRWGVGPYLDGLFSQSNLGVVTQMTMWLCPIPSCFDLLQARLDGDTDLPRLIDALQPLFLSGVLRNPVKIMNGWRRLSVETRYPWSIMGQRVPLPRSVVRELVPEAWTLASTIELPSPQHRAAERKLLRSALAAAGAHVTFRPETAVQRRSGLWQALFRPVSDFDVAATYWRKRTAPPPDMDPDRDRCGAIWCSPVVPLRGTDVARAVRIVQRVVRSARLDPMIGITVLNARTAYVVVPLLFDRDTPGADREALACADELHRELARRGYFPYRLGVNSMDALQPGARDNGTLRRALRRALDPNDVLSPGRYPT